MESKTALFNRLHLGGCSTLRLAECPTFGTIAIVGKKGRDVICFCLDPGRSRTRQQQKIADRWRGTPPVNLSSIDDADQLIKALDSRDFDHGQIMSTMQSDLVFRDGKLRRGCE